MTMIFSFMMEDFRRNENGVLLFGTEGELPKINQHLCSLLIPSCTRPSRRSTTAQN